MRILILSLILSLLITIPDTVSPIMWGSAIIINSVNAIISKLDVISDGVVLSSVMWGHSVSVKGYHDKCEGHNE